MPKPESAGKPAYSLVVDYSKLARVLGPVFDALKEGTFGERIEGELDFSLDYLVESVPENVSPTEWHAKKDSLLAAMKLHADGFYRKNPEVRRDKTESFGLKNLDNQPLGFTDNKTSSFSDVVEFMLYLVRILKDAGVDDDLLDDASEKDEPDLRGVRFVASELRRARFLQSDNQVVPQVLSAMCLARACR